MMTFLAAVWGVLLELAPWLLLGAVAAGLLHGLVPPDLVQRRLSGRGGVVRAVLLGIPLPLCSCGVIPAGLGLKKDGAGDGAAVGFLTATPQTGVDSILVSASFLGWPFALAKVAAALVTGITSGLLVEQFAPTPAAAPAPAAATCGLPPAPPRRPGVRDMAAHGLDLIRMIWGWLAFGVLLSAALGLLLPHDAFAGLATGSGLLLAFGAALLVSVPLYVCATASVPIAAALVAGGMPTGAAMVFLMAGPATNIATLGAVRKTFGPRVLAIYLGTIVAGSIAFGLLYERLAGAIQLPAQALDHAHHAADHATWWAQLSAGLLVALIAIFAAQDARTALARLRPASPAAPRHTVGVEGMTCGGCAARLTRTLQQLDGVETVDVSLEAKQATVTGAVTLPALRAAVEQAGFSAR